MQMNPSEQFAAHVAEARYEDLPDPIVARAKERLADSVGVMSAGARGVGIPGMVDMAKAWGGAEQASIFNYGDKVPARVAAFVNSLQLRSFDFEAIDAEGFLTRWPAHVTSTTVPATLALAEWKAMSGKDFLLAMLLGDDMACRLTEATRFDPLGCFDGNGTANCLGAAAIASKALGLGAEQTLAAFGIASTWPVGPCRTRRASGPSSWGTPCPPTTESSPPKWPSTASRASTTRSRVPSASWTCSPRAATRPSCSRSWGSGTSATPSSSPGPAAAGTTWCSMPHANACMAAPSTPRRSGRCASARPRASRTASSRSAARASATASSTAGSPFPRTS